MRDAPEPVGPGTVAAWARHLGVDPDSLRVDALRAELATGTLTEAFTTAAREHPSATLTVDARTATHGQLHERAARAASVLAEHGAGPGVGVLLCAPASIDFVAAYLAALRTGAVVVLANPAYTGAELATLVRRSRAALLVHGPHGPAVPDTAHAPRRLALDDLTAAAAGAPPAAPAPAGSGDSALLAFTSGTTGEPKGVPLTHGMLLSSVRAAMRAWRWRADDTLVHTLPLFHQHGLSGLHAALLAGSDAVVLPGLDVDRLVRAVEESGATVLFGVPAVHQRLAAVDVDDLRPLRRLRLATSGSAPLTPALATAVHERIGTMPLERYGLTESGLDVSNPYDGPRVPGSVGYPLPGVEAELRDTDGGPVPPGEEGEIVLRGPQVFAGYLDDPDATDDAFWPGGWFRTGDLGRHDDDGRLRITGRRKDVIITGGMNVSPQEVEMVLAEHPGVDEAAVAGVASDRWGEEVTAWVVPRPGARLDEAAVVAFCRTRLAAFKCPKRVHRVDMLPRNPMGKIVRGDLPGWTGERA